MKRIIFLVIVLLTIACEKEEKGYIITAETEGFEEGTVVYVNAISQSNRPVIIDSTTIQNGTFKLVLPIVENPDFNYLTFNNAQGNVLFLAENNPIQITMHKDSLRSVTVKGGVENDLFFTYLNTVQKYSEEKIDLNNQRIVATKLNESDKASKIILQQTELHEKEKTFRKELAEQNLNSLVAIMALRDLLNLKHATAKEVKLTFSNLNDSLKTTRLGKNLEQIITASIGKIDVGSEAVDFSAPNPAGKTISLKDAMGKVTIIDFWASWCKPCRIENPHVVNVYNKYHDKGLNIIGVSLDKNQEQWIKAIADDRLTWSHVSNLKFWSEPIAKLYGVQSIPATFILDEKGNIIAKNLRGQALENKIAEILGDNSL